MLKRFFSTIVAVFAVVFSASSQAPDPELEFVVVLPAPSLRGRAGGEVLLHYLFHQSVSLTPLIHHIDNIADVNADATGKFGVEEDVTRE